MPWQDELRTLDADVASGVISSQQYRRRRDELLVDASDSAGGRDPFPPPFRWSEGQDAPTEAGAEATRVIDPAAERTQLVPRAQIRAASPGAPPWLPPGAFTERPGAPPRADFFDESPPVPYRLVTALLLTVTILALLVWSILT